MKVKLKNDYPKKGWFSYGKVYSVIEIYFFRESNEVELRLYSDEEIPVLEDLKYFEIIDDDLPNNWKFLQSNNLIKLSFEEFLIDGFWEDFFNDKEDAIIRFKDIQKKIS